MIKVDIIPPVDINHIVDALRVERDRIDAAISALTGGQERNARSTGRRRAGMAKTTTPNKAKGRLSPAARKRISEAAKARWAKIKKAGKKAV